MANNPKMTDNLIMVKDIEPLGKIIGQNIRRLRKNVLGWSQEKLAEIYGCDSSYIAQVEIGIKVPGATARKKFAQALRCSPDDLLTNISDSFQTKEEPQPIFITPTRDSELIANVVELVESYFNDRRLKISAKRKGLLVAKLYEYSIIEDSLPDDQIIKSYLRTV